METGTVSLDPLYHLPLYPQRSRKEATGFHLVLLDEDGEVLVSEDIRRSSRRKLSVRILQNIPYSPKAVAREVRKERTVLARVERPSETVSIESFNLKHETDEWVLDWTADQSDWQPLVYHVASTLNGGNSWSDLADSLDATSWSFDPRRLAGGEK